MTHTAPALPLAIFADPRRPPEPVQLSGIAHVTGITARTTVHHLEGLVLRSDSRSEKLDAALTDRPPGHTILPPRSEQ